MDNKKKHGVVLGITIIVIALIIWWVATAIMDNKSSSSNSNKKPTITQSSQSNNNSNNSNSKKPIANNTNTNNNTNKEETTSKPSKDTESNNLSEGSGVYQLIDQNSLGVASEKQEIVVVANKKLLLIDGQVGGSGEKQLQYVADVLTTNSDKLSLFLNESAYNSISVGSKLLVTYKVYTNDVGIEFPVVVDAQVTE